MVLNIPGHISVSHDFFEDLEDDLDVSVDQGPGGVVEVAGDREHVLSFLDDFGIRLEECEVIEE